jgi:hypothetical protein
MRSIKVPIRRLAAAAMVASALGLGTAPALAVPPAPDESRTCTRSDGCNPRGCDNACRARGGISGRCNGDQCLCLF